MTCGTIAHVDDAIFSTLLVECAFSLVSCFRSNSLYSIRVFRNKSEFSKSQKRRENKKEKEKTLKFKPGLYEVLISEGKQSRSSTKWRLYLKKPRRYAVTACSFCSETVGREIFAIHEGDNWPQWIDTCEFCVFLLPAIDPAEHRIEIIVGLTSQHGQQIYK